MQKIMPCLWFDDRIEEAVNFYASVFKDAKVTAMTRYGEAGPLPKGKVMVATMEIEGQEFMLLNGGPIFKFSEAVSFVVKCETQEDVDYYWEKLTADGGAESQCGWLKDKYGLSWQIVPNIIPKLLQDKDAKKVDRVMQAVMGMKKLDVAALEKAAGR
jgi:predicted 3-demethylubiquinone-9 3-methyltransferase (glyoxalase superfamily)